MNKFKVTSLLCGGLISLASPALLGQTSSSGQSSSGSLGTSGSSQSSSGSSLGQSSSSSSLGSSSSSYGMHSGKDVRLSQLMHATVQAQDGKQIGHIRDFTVDPQSGRIEFAILSTSGSSSGTQSGATDTSTSGRETTSSSRSSVGSTSSSGSSSSYGAMTGKLIPVPWQLFSHSLSSSQLGSSSGSSSTTGSPTLTLNIDSSKLQSAPTFEASNWSELEQGTLNQQVYSHFGVSRMSGAGTSGSSISGQGASGSQDSSSSSQGSSSGSTPQK